MHIYILYFVVILLANTIGAVSGMGGGVIIKPSLDAIGYHNLQQIVLYSSIAVFTMSLSSTVKQVKSGTKINMKNVLFLSIGAVIGGYLGNNLLTLLLSRIQDSAVLLVQIFITVITLGASLLYINSKQIHLDLKKSAAFSFVGLALGCISALLGIGGGPINVALLTLCFGFTVKQATVYSIATILFAQASQLTTAFLQGDFSLLDTRFLLVIIPAALLGGYMGGLLNKQMPEKLVVRLYSFTIIGVLLINLYNLLSIIL
ncbi:TSUP family transporter [Erwinia sp. CPCC 100877]|nr:TSUP family transporter [Erwinia sp. CPCC 100877]